MLAANVKWLEKSIRSNRYLQ